MTDSHDTAHGHAHDSGHNESGHDESGHDESGHGGSGHGTHGHKTRGHRASGHAARDTAGQAIAAPESGGVSLASLLRGTAAVAILAVVLLPFFFVIYRLTLLDAVPHEDNARFLLSLLGLPGGAVPGSPYGYRGLALLAAVPFYFALPPLPLANAPAGQSPELVQATAALAFLSYLSLVGTLYAAYRLARDRAGQDAATALLAAAMLFVLCWYTGFAALDPLAILLTTLGLYLLANRPGFTLLLLATPVMNETVAVIFVVWLSLRCIASQADRDAFGLQWATSLAALLTYVALIAVVHLPGHSFHFYPGDYMETLRSNIAAQATLRGVLQNLLPVALLLGLGLIGHVGRPRFARPSRDAPRPRWEGLFRPIDLLLIPVMAGVALVLTQRLEVGPIVLHAAPLFVVPAAAVLVNWLAGTPADKGQTP